MHHIFLSLPESSVIVLHFSVRASGLKVGAAWVSTLLSSIWPKCIWGSGANGKQIFFSWKIDPLSGVIWQRPSHATVHRVHRKQAGVFCVSEKNLEPCSKTGPFTVHLLLYAFIYFQHQKNHGCVTHHGTVSRSKKNVYHPVVKHSNGQLANSYRVSWCSCPWGCSRRTWAWDWGHKTSFSSCLDNLN